MRFTLLSLLLIIFCGNCFGEQLLMSRPRSKQEVDRSKFYDYKSRLKQRRADALSVRSQNNAGKVHKYWTAMVYPVKYNTYYYNTGSRPVYIRRSELYYREYYQYRR